MATLTIPNSFVAATGILSAEVNANFNAVATFLNTTKINQDNIQDSGVTTAKIADGAITTLKIADANVTTVKIADSNVTTAKIADANVTTAKILDANVTDAKLSATLLAKVIANAEVIVDSGNGHGGTATFIRRFSNIRKNVGSDITYADSASAGATWTINTDGVYSFSYHDTGSGGGIGIGITVNDTATTTSIGTGITYAQGLRAMVEFGTANFAQFVSWTGRLSATDVVRAHTNGGPDSTNAFSMFTATKVSG